MCGIFGVFNYKNEKLPREGVAPIRELIRNLADASTIRGRDSAGICVVNDNEVVVFKHHVPGSKIHGFKGYNKALESVNTETMFRSVIGHTRAQTQGTFRNNRNNHPIICGKTVGVHNGMIYNDDEVFRDIKDKVNRIAQVDSEAIFALINMYLNEEESLESAVTLSSEKLSGSYACAVINADIPDKIALFGNPIHAADFTVRGICVFASSSKILRDSIHETKGFSEDEPIEWTMMPQESGIVVDLKNNTTVDIKLKTPKINTYIGGYYANRKWDCYTAQSCLDDCRFCKVKGQ